MEKTILTQMKEVKDWFTSVPEVLSYDWETTGLDYMKMEPVGVSFCDGKRVCYIDLWENDEAKEILEFLGTVFIHGLFVAHNIKFDIKCCRKFCGVEPTELFCTYIASYLLDENRKKHGLKELVGEELGIPIKEISKWDKAISYGYHSDEWYKYCHNDSIWAYKLYEIYKPQILEQGLDHVFYDIEMPFVHVVADMEINGILIDQKELKKLEIKTRNKLIELEDRMFTSIGMSVTIQTKLFEQTSERILPINLRSGPKLIKIIENKCGLKVPTVKDKNTGKYKKSTSAKVLVNLKGQHPFIDYLLDYKKVRKLYDAYIVPAFDLIDSDGRVRPSFGIVKTGRTNCRNPNLQQLPNINKSFPELDYRSIYIAPDNRKLVGGDFSGQELRVLGEVSGDTTIINSYLNGFDLHLVTANYIFNLGLSDKALTDNTDEHKEAAKKFKDERYRAKNGVNFPIVYGSSEYGISYSMKVPVETAREWREKFFELYPGVFEAVNATASELEDNQEVSTLMGRKRRFPRFRELPKYAPGKTPSKSRAIRQAFNFKIQGFSADQIKIAAIRSRKAHLKVLLIIHDEIVIESSLADSQQDARTLRQCMEEAVKLSIPFTADVKIGDKYSELK